ncbi:glycosyltransferase family 1 protein [Jannaschia sp. Os4]|uniref:glycosyltransferase n=1 Tax=Jannaschia sp. Os4 TaxID=2807617 RepID=UPI0019394EE0|nr:glycosyltransferase [Jannaschia sp. Os4]MBM2576891.1 glycosyltransferase family 1 protein [Jannaschia sp. Os4]
MNQTRRPPPQWAGPARLPGLEGRIPERTRGTVLLSTAGSLGDLYPVLSIARALEASGLSARLALAPDDCEVAHDWGLTAHPIGPSAAEVCRRLGVSRDDIAASVLRDPGPMLREVGIPMAAALVPEMDVLCEGVDVVAATAFALTAPLAAERAALPFVPLVLQPMLAWSALDAPRAGAFRVAVPRPGNPLTRGWNRAVLRLARAELRRRHGREMTALRARLGLRGDGGTPLIDHGDARVPVRLGLWDPAFAPVPPDAVPGLEAVGFPPAPKGGIDDALLRWIDDGPPVLVATLGSVAQRLAGPRFWREVVAMARGLGLRSVLLHGAAEVPEGSDVAARRYAPHADLFPRAAAVLHHGGIGSTAEALRAARPQLVVPIGGDQPDNGARLTRMGLAAVVPPGRFRARRAAFALSRVIEGFDHDRAEALARGIAGRDGATEAALRLAAVALEARR